MIEVEGEENALVQLYFKRVGICNLCTHMYSAALDCTLLENKKD